MTTDSLREAFKKAFYEAMPGRAEEIERVIQAYLDAGVRLEDLYIETEPLEIVELPATDTHYRFGVRQKVRVKIRSQEDPALTWEI